MLTGLPSFIRRSRPVAAKVNAVGYHRDASSLDRLGQKRLLDLGMNGRVGLGKGGHQTKAETTAPGASLFLQNPVCMNRCCEPPAK